MNRLAFTEMIDNGRLQDTGSARLCDGAGFGLNTVSAVQNFAAFSASSTG